MRVLIVAEYYPRADDPARGIWAHRQALAAQAAGADLRVIVLHRPLPPLHSLRAGEVAGMLAPLRQPRTATVEGVPVRYVRYLSPPRPISYGSWGAWAAPVLARELARLRRTFRPQLVHAHYAVPAGDTVRRAAPELPLVVSVHGHDVLGPTAGHANVRRTLRHARLVLGNSTGTAARCAALGARDTRVVRLGATVPPRPRPLPAQPVLVTVGNLVQRKRHADVIVALALLAGRHPALRYLIVGDGPERAQLQQLARERGVVGQVEFAGALSPQQTLERLHEGTLFVLPSTDEAFGVAYIEAMAAGIPAIGCRGEDGPEEIARAGGGIELVPPQHPPALAERIDWLLTRPQELLDAGERARDTVRSQFTWERCGAATVEAYADALSEAER